LAQIESDDAFLKEVGRADLLPQLAAAREAAAKELVEKETDADRQVRKVLASL
jgi:hypothetical protein